jgi:Protein of unknown function (DUF2914)
MRRIMILALVLPLTVVAEEAKKPAEAPKAPAAAPAPTATPNPLLGVEIRVGHAEKAAEETTATSELKVGTGVEKKEIVGAAEEFKIAADTKIWAWAKAASLAADAKVTLAFSKGDKEAFRKELQAAGSPWRVTAYKTFRAGDGGDWTAKLLGPDGAELASAKFKVEITK